MICSVSPWRDCCDLKYSPLLFPIAAVAAAATIAMAASIVQWGMSITHMGPFHSEKGVVLSKIKNKTLFRKETRRCLLFYHKIGLYPTSCVFGVQKLA